MKFSHLVSPAAALMAVGVMVQTAESVEVGDDAPSITATTHTGEEWKSSDHADKTVVYFFFPAAMTGGCTKQSCAYRDDLESLKEKGVEVVGVSGDAVSGLKHFDDKHDFGYMMLSDFDGKISEALGVPSGKGATLTFEIDGKKVDFERGVTTKRWTVVTKGGKVVYKQEVKNAAGDSKAVMAFLKQ